MAANGRLQTMDRRPPHRPYITASYYLGRGCVTKTKQSLNLHSDWTNMITLDLPLDLLRPLLVNLSEAAMIMTIRALCMVMAGL